MTGTVKAGAVFASASDSGRGGARPSRLELLVFRSQNRKIWQYTQFIEPGLGYLISRPEQRADDCAAMAIIATAGCIGKDTVAKAIGVLPSEIEAGSEGLWQIAGGAKMPTNNSAVGEIGPGIKLAAFAVCLTMSLDGFT